MKVAQLDGTIFETFWVFQFSFGAWVCEEGRVIVIFLAVAGIETGGGEEEICLVGRAECVRASALNWRGSDET